MAMFEEATAKLEAGEEVEWSWLMTEVLGLPMRYLPAVQLALVQRRWRTAKNPKAYVRKVARREAAKMESSGEQGETLKVPKNLYNEDGQVLSLQEYIDHLSYADTPVKNGGVWRARNPWDEAVSVDNDGRVLPEVNGRPVPEHLLMPEDDEPDAKLVINWQRVAEEANLDSEESYILALRCAGLHARRYFE
jgi:hypothetical protein